MTRTPGPKRRLATGLAALSLFVAACAETSPALGGGEAGGGGAASGDHAEESVPEGLQIFRTVGCAACHGQDGEGNIGPAMAGHTRQQVLAQVRDPEGDIMPAFPPEQLSDADLEEIVEWVTGLGDEMVMAHEESPADEEGPELSLTEQGHLRLILASLAAENSADALHHAEHFAANATPELAELAEALVADFEADDLHDVEQRATAVLGPVATEDFDSVSVHLGMAIAAHQRDDFTDAEHHLASAVEAAAGHDHQADMQEFLDGWRTAADPHDVIDQVYVYLGLDHQD